MKINFSLHKFLSSLMPCIEVFPFPEVNNVVIGGAMSPREIFERYSKNLPIPDPVASPLPDDGFRITPKFEDFADAQMQAAYGLRDFTQRVSDMISQPRSDDPAPPSVGAKDD